MQVYTPNTVLIPQEIKEHPVIRSYLIHYFHPLIKSPHGEIKDSSCPTPDVPLNRLLTLEEKEEYLLSGDYPLFHDIFLREYQGGRQVVLIAPDESSLVYFIGYPQIWHNGKQIPDAKIVRRHPVKHQPSNFHHLYIINSDATTQFQAGDVLELRWTKPDFSFTRKVTLQPYLWRDDPPKLTLNTLQKDEPLEWIRDWILYHHRIHGVERVLLYDNQSQSRKELIEYLPQLESESLEICLIPWDMSYSPFALSCCQRSQIVHAYHWLWDKTSWDINCDIDEYLINRTGMSLTRYLKRYANPLNPALILACDVMSAYRQDSTDGQGRLPQQTDFTYVTAAPNTRGYGKTITAGAKRLAHLNVHVALPGSVPKSYFLLLLKHLLFRKPQQKIPTRASKPRRYINALSYRYYRLSYQDLEPQPTRISLTGYWRWMAHILDATSFITKYIFLYRKKEWGLYFYHYWGLNRNRGGTHDELQVAQHKSDYQDIDVLKIFKKAGVGQYYSE